MYGTTVVSDALAEIDGVLLRPRRPWSLSRHRVTTDEGTALRERAAHARRAWLSDRLAGWEQHESAELGRLLSRFADGLDGPA